MQPMSTTGGCRSVKLPLLPLLDDLLDMLAVAVAGWKPGSGVCVYVPALGHARTHKERSALLASRGYDELSGTVGGCEIGRAHV